MSLIPWKREGDQPFSRDLEDFMTRVMRPFDVDFENRLPAVFTRRQFPAMNIAEDERTYTVSLELPGMDEEGIDIELMGTQLIVSGERKWKEEKKEKEYHRVESQYGSFQRTVTLPENLRLEKDAIEATFEKGVLEIRIPKLEPTPAKKIPIRAS